YQYTNPIYSWHKEQIEKEFRTYDYPGRPYAAAKVFIKNSKPLMDEPITVLYTLLKEVSRKRKSCWRKTYELLELLDNSNIQLQQKRMNKSIQDNNPKMIFLHP
ncbi:MAG: hypothetical protein IKY55_05120, partial [Phascolarctobacterium sp.]|nr:hypothetical protein [Phascolarctobacterium sp.]